jgi:PAS domain S-box-containing protein
MARQPTPVPIDESDIAAMSAGFVARIAMLESIEQVAGIGGWQLDLASGALTWTALTRLIHEVEDDFVPQLETAIDFYAPEARPVIEAAIDSAVRTGAGWDLELPLITATGRQIWVRAFGRPIMEKGEAVRLVGAFQDISEQRARQAELFDALSRADQAKQEMERFFDVSPDLLCITDERGRLIRASRTVEAVLGDTESALLGQSFHHRVHPEDWERTLEAMQALNEPNKLVSIVNRQPNPDGGWRDVEWRATRMEQRVYISARDITQQKQDAAALEAARAAAEAAADAKSAFLANMSHEIRTPMNGVLGMLELLLAGELTEAQRDLARSGHEAARALLTVLNDVLDVAKLDAGEVAIEALPVEPRGLTRDILRLFEGLAAEKGLGLRLEVAATTPHWVTSDPTRLRQILTNLVSNALKFTPAGEVALHVDYDAHKRLSIAVRDTGVGMDEAAKARLFQRFSQADTTITRRFGGTGLGLAICKGLADRMGGAITVDSTPGEGSTFTVILPALECAPPRASVAQADLDQPQTPLDVLVAEDYPINQKLIALLLNAMGHRCVIASNGAEALAALDQSRFDVVLMDMQMPVMDGPTAARAIRARSDVAAQVTIVALTANADEENAELCRAAGMDEVLTKPIDTQKLAAVLAGARVARGLAQVA